jgi:type II secretory pathway component GspD/PulD (secretin)
MPQQAGPTPTTGAGPRIQADARTNQVLVSGTPQDVRRVEDAIRTLDVPIDAGSTRAFRIPLTNVRADATAQVLRNLFESSPTLWRAGGQPGSRPTVLAHPETNSLIVSASDETIAAIRRFVQELDVPQAPPTPAEPVATRIEDRRVKSFEWDSRTVHQAVVELARRMDLSMIVSPDALTKAQNAVVSMRVRDLTLKEVLDLLTKPYGLTWRVEDFGILRIVSAS